MEYLSVEVQIGKGERRSGQWPLTVDTADAVGVRTPKGYTLSVTRNKTDVARVIISPSGEIVFVETGILEVGTFTEDLWWLMGCTIARYVRDFVLGDPEAEVVVTAFGGDFTAM